MNKNTLILLMLAALSLPAFSYNIVERTTLIEDRLKLQESLRPLGHDFYFDANAFFSGDALDLADDLSQAATDVDGGSDAFSTAETLVNKWNGKELGGRLNLGLGVPLFKFNAWGLKFVPELIRADFGFTANVGISKEILDPADFIEMAGDDIDPQVKSALEVIDLETFTDIAQASGDGASLYDVLLAYSLGEDGNGNNDPNVDANPILEGAVRDQQASLEDVVLETQLVDALSNETPVPNLDIYLKADLKVGPKVAWYGEKFFGHVNLYGLMRVDVFNRITSATIQNGGSSLDTPSDTEETNLTLDAAVGYREQNYSIIASMDEVKVANLSEADDANNLYGTPILFKLYAEGKFKPFDFMKLKVFGGVHKRTGYGFADGLFLGTDLGAYVWGDRLGVQFRTQLDKEHITLAPQFKFWVMQLEGMYKLPITDDVDGRKTGSILGVNLRIFI